MQWFQPWAWIAIPLIGLPVIVHLFSRKPPKVVVFPSLQFFVRTAARPTRRSKLSDILLLLIRVAIFIAAIAALAQPRFSKMAAVANVDLTSTAIITDIGVTSGNTTIAGDTLTLSVASSDLQSSIAQAVNWLTTRPAPRSLVIRSPFARSTIDSATLAALPSDVTLSLERTAPLSFAALDSARSAIVSTPRDTVRWVTGLTRQDAADVTQWVHQNGGAVVLAVSPLDQSEGSSLNNAASNQVVPQTSDNSYPVLYTAGNGEEASLDSITKPSVDRTNRLLRVARDARLKENAFALNIHDHAANSIRFDTARTFPLLFDGDGRTAVAGGSHNGAAAVVSLIKERPSNARLLLLALSDNPAIAALRQLDGFDTTSTDEATLKRWESVPSSKPIGLGARSDINSVSTHARLVWVLVLLLLGLEWWMRRNGQVSNEQK